MNVSETLQTFFEEKQLDERIYTFEVEGVIHFFESAAVIELIHQAPEVEKQEIWKKLSQLDFYNRNIHHFLEFLAKGYVLTQAKSERGDKR